MRIRFVTRAQLQVLQASRMEKYTMPDGTIPLSGLSLSVVCRQWVYIQNITPGSSIPFPIAFNDFYVSVGNDTNENVNSNTQILSMKNGKVWGIRPNGTNSNVWGYVIAIGV